MFYGRKRVEDLVSRMIFIPPDREAALEMVYALIFPELPSTLAEIILENPQLVIGSNSALSSNLAFGLVDTGLEYREESLRNEKYRVVFRRVNALGYELIQREFRCPLVSNTESQFWMLSTGAQAAKDLAQEESIPGSVRAAFAEQLLLALSECRELMLLLLQHLSSSWSEGKKHAAIRTIARTTGEALSNTPIAESTLLHEATGPARFHRINLENDSFRQEAERVEDSLICGFRSQSRAKLLPVLQ